MLRPAGKAPRGTGRRANPPCSVSSDTSLASSSTPAASNIRPASPVVQSEVCCADLADQSVRPPAREREVGLLPARDRYLGAGRDVFEQLRERVQTRAVGDRVQIVEHQHERALEPQPARSRGAGRAPTRSIRPGPTARRTPRARSARRGGSRPRRNAGTPRCRRLDRPARPTRMGVDQPPPRGRAGSSCRTPPARRRSPAARATHIAGRSRRSSRRCWAVPMAGPV